jgi:hypothetical protein
MFKGRSAYNLINKVESVQVTRFLSYNSNITTINR